MRFCARYENKIFRHAENVGRRNRVIDRESRYKAIFIATAAAPVHARIAAEAACEDAHMAYRDDAAFSH